MNQSYQTQSFIQLIILTWHLGKKITLQLRKDALQLKF